MTNQSPASASLTVDRPSVADLPHTFRDAYAALGTGRLVTSGPCTIDGPQMNEATQEPKNFNGKMKFWLTPVLEARPEATNVDYQTKAPISAAGSIEVYLTPAQVESWSKKITERFTAGETIQARSGDVAAYDVPSSTAVSGICQACHISVSDLPYVLLIERPASALAYEEARTLRQGAQLVESGRMHYMTVGQQQTAAKGLYGASAKAALASLLNS